jgi:hypothetical protein
MTAIKTPHGMKGDRVRALLTINPDWDDAQIADKVGCHPGYVQQLRRKMYAEEDKSLEAQGLVTPSAEPAADGITQVLEERGSRYGNFLDHARITYQLKGMAHGFAAEKGKVLDPDQAEALDMIFHKIGRILNGDPNYADSWVDIAGYAKLVADRLEGKVR